MNEITIKSGTRAEIIEYIRQKNIKTITVNSLGKTPIWSDYPKTGEHFEFSHRTIENQIDTIIQEGSPLVEICLNCHGAPPFREQFLVTDYGDIRTNIEMKKLDDLDFRKRRIDAIKQVMEMEIDAEKRWDRILKIVDEYRNVLIQFTLPSDDQKVNYA